MKKHFVEMEEKRIFEKKNERKERGLKYNKIGKFKEGELKLNKREINSLEENNKGNNLHKGVKRKHPMGDKSFKKDHKKSKKRRKFRIT